MYLKILKCGSTTPLCLCTDLKQTVRYIRVCTVYTRIYNTENILYICRFGCRCAKVEIPEYETLPSIMKFGLLQICRQCEAEENPGRT